MSDEVLEQVIALDELATAENVMFNVGPVMPGDARPDGFGEWAARVIQNTVNSLFTVNVASKDGGIRERSIGAAAEAIRAIGQGTAGGEGNFRFAAIAHSPVGTPFYPAAFHEGPDSFTIGLESPNVLTDAIGVEGGGWREEGGGRRFRLCRALWTRSSSRSRPSEMKSRRHREGSTEGSMSRRRRESTHPSVRPSKLSRMRHSDQLRPPPACAQITDAIGSVSVKTCGYNGLILPPLEDPVLAQRLSEGRYGVQELLLYSSVCGTGLDVVPLPGATAVEQIAGLLWDVAALAHKWDKPLSARLLPVPGKEVGDEVTFENPFLVDARVTAP